MCLKKLVLVFLSVLCLSLPIFSDVVLTEDEYQIIISALEISDEELTAAENEIQRLEKLSEEQEKELAMLGLNLDLQLKSSEQLKKRVERLWIDRTIFGILGFSGGYGIKTLIEMSK